MIVIHDKPIDKKELVCEYAERIVDGMDIDTLCQLVYEMLVIEKSEYDDDELLAEIEEYYPDMLEHE